MVELKHVGRLKSNSRKVLVAFRTLPGDADYCLVVQTENLTDSQHDAIIRAVESTAAQQAYEFGEVLSRSTFPDGSIMLANLHVQGKLLKLKTDEVFMTPTVHTSILLSELNQLIAEQRGCSVNDLAIVQEVPSEVDTQELARVREIEPVAEAVVEQPTTENGILTDELLANKYRADAARLEREVIALRQMAEELSPSQSVTPIEVAESVAATVVKVTEPKATSAKKTAKPATKATAKPAAKTSAAKKTAAKTTEPAASKPAAKTTRKATKA